MTGNDIGFISVPEVDGVFVSGLPAACVQVGFAFVGDCAEEVSEFFGGGDFFRHV